MKKVVTLLLLFCMMVFMTACGSGLGDSQSEVEGESSEESQADGEEKNESSDQQIDEKDNNEGSNQQTEKTSDEVQQESMTRDQAYEITTELIDKANEIGENFREDKNMVDVIVEGDKLKEYETELGELLEPIAIGTGLEKLTAIISEEYLQTLYITSNLDTDMMDAKFEILEHEQGENEERLHISYATLESEMTSLPSGFKDIHFVKKDEKWKISDVGEASFEKQPLNLSQEDVEKAGHKFIKEIEHEGKPYVVYQDKNSDFIWYRHKNDSSIGYEVKEIYENM